MSDPTIRELIEAIQDSCMREFGIKESIKISPIKGSYEILKEVEAWEGFRGQRAAAAVGNDMVSSETTLVGAYSDTGELVGVLAYEYAEKNEYGPDPEFWEPAFFYVEEMGTSGKVKGAGRALISYVIGLAKKNNEVEPTEVRTLSLPGVGSFYQHLGFKMDPGSRGTYILSASAVQTGKL